jgi:hypothetical protein
MFTVEDIKEISPYPISDYVASQAARLVNSRPDWTGKYDIINMIELVLDDLNKEDY